jgi:cytochrome c peroxidase
MKRIVLGAALSLFALPLAASGEDLAGVGRLIFFDKNLSTPPGQACSACHDPKTGFTDPERGLPVSRGVLTDRLGSRNAQSVAYAAYSPSLHYDKTLRPGIMEPLYVGGFFWDGRAKTLEDQVKEPFVNPLEMHNPDSSAVVRSVRTAAYAAALGKACGLVSLDDSGAVFDCVAKALSAYLRSPEVNPFTSKFDHWQAGRATLSTAEKRGLELFTGKAKCKNCHSVEPVVDGKPLFTNFGHQNTGVPRNPDLPYYRLSSELNPAGRNFIDRGLGDALRKAGVAEEDAAREDGKFKIPSLRNCAVTPPYMHNGLFKTLREVVVFNNTRDIADWPAPEVPQTVHRHVSARHGAHKHGAAPEAGGHHGRVEEGTFGRLGLNDGEIDDIVAFLETLTDGYTPRTNR